MQGYPLLKLMIGAVVLLAMAGCSSIGPSSVRRDRLHYSTAVADSWKEQLLLNIVKTRYGDAPAFLEVESVVSGYSLETGVSISGQFSPENLRGDTLVGGGVAGTFTDRPTISYSPLTGEKFARSLMAPVPLDAIWFVIQGGVPADFLLGLTVQSFARYHNFGLYAGQVQTADPEFIRVLKCMRALQQAKAAESEIIEREDHVELQVHFRPIDAGETVLAEQQAELKQLLGIPAEMDRVKVVFGTNNPEPGVIAIRTRSLMQILSTLGMGVRIPPTEQALGGIVPVEASQALEGFTVYSGREEPDEAFGAVPYQGLWFWIDRRDLASKTTLAAVTVLFNFLEGSERVSPVLTIPTH